VGIDPIIDLSPAAAQTTVPLPDEGRSRDDRESPLVVFKLLQQPQQRRPQSRNVPTRGFPHDVGVDVEVP